MTEGVKLFLSNLGLIEHYGIFVTKGFDSEDDLPHLNEDDLNSMYISNPESRKLILDAAKSYQISKEHVLYEWLRSKGLEHYFISFVENDVIDLNDVSRMNLPDDDIYDVLEMTLPGHRRRLERAVRNLTKKKPVTLPSVDIPTSQNASLKDDDVTIHTKTSQHTELPVALGRWGKPKCLRDAKYDFLLLDATVVSTLDPRDRVTIEFMVDSGSDVVTIRQEVLDTMDLELIGPINSKGVHASRVKNLYRAHLQVGNELLEIEVMGESYDSIGSRVIRHFRHYISGTSHIWLKGNYFDTTLSSCEASNGSVQDDQIVQTTAPVDVDKNSESNVTMFAEEFDDVIVKCKTKAEPNSSPEEGESLRQNKPETESKLDPNSGMVQSDAAKLSAIDFVNSYGNNSANIEVEQKIDFKFISNNHNDSETNNSKETSDETDKLLHGSSEIIDVRPMIAANRKRHASSSKGFEPSNVSPDRANGKIVKKNKLSPGGRPHLFESSVKAKFVSKVDKIKEADDNGLDTVINHRAVYYRSQVKLSNQNLS